MNKKATSSHNSNRRFEQRVTFWGVRGTLPTPGTETLHYGGNTSCVEILSQDNFKETTQSIICDAGTGLASLGDQALIKGTKEFHIFLSHMHYDHILGFLRFKPFFKPDSRITIYGQEKCGMTLREIFDRFFVKPFFPLNFSDLPACQHTRFCNINGMSEIKTGDVRVEFHELNHPQDACAFRVWAIDGSTSVVYATDHEHGTEIDEKLVHFCQDASLLLYDSTYAEAGFHRYKGWGHSTPASGARIASAANVAAYGLFHHDPESSDADLESYLLPEAKRIFQNSFLTVENQTLSVHELSQGKDQG